MLRKLLPAVAAMAVLAATRAVGADDPAPVYPPAAGEPQLQDDGQPYPPDGVTDPNAAYPTDGAGETTDQGEAGAVPPDAAAPGGDNPPPVAPPAKN
jgi:hypothetical protein